MTDLPIIFSAPMILALLAGRKTMTRRLAWVSVKDGDIRYRPSIWTKVQLGDRLWVKEGFAYVSPDEYPRPHEQCKIEYRAESNGAPYPGAWPPEEARGNPDAPKWRSPLHLPRQRSRLTMTVTEKRIERLQDITEADAKAEGISDDDPAMMGGLFRDLWDSLHGPGSWDANPEVVCLSFRCIKANIDKEPPQ